jgi:hypothetical protein
MLFVEPSPAGLEEVLERRRRAGLDRLDEVWEGVLHMVPAPSGQHAYVSQQLAEILSGAARHAGLVTTMAEFNLGESEQDFRVPDGGWAHPYSHTRMSEMSCSMSTGLVM